MIKSHLLYQLSYAPGTSRESLRKSRSFSKAPPRCPAADAIFPGLFRPCADSEKAAGFRRLFLHFANLRRFGAALRSKPLGGASAVMVVAVVVVMIPVM